MRLLLLTDDLLFGSRLQAELGGVHDVTLSSVPGGDVDAIVADLTVAPQARLAALSALDERPPTLAYYSHVEAAVRTQAEAAGIELVVPRSRIAREALALVARLAS